MVNNTDYNDYLQFINDNYDRLKEGLIKNGTYDDDSFHNAIISTSNSIINHPKKIDDYESYFFWCARNKYLDDKKYKDRDNKREVKGLFEQQESPYFDVGDDVSGDTRQTDVQSYLNYLIEEDFDNETYHQNVNKLYKNIIDVVGKEFSPLEADIYCMYKYLKANGKIKNKKQLCKIFKLSESKTNNILAKINKWVKNNNEIKELKSKIYD